jgi:hypothetical protein
MRAVREQPRLVLARTLGAICLVLAGIAIGSALDRGDTDRMNATHLRLVSAQRSLADGRAGLRTANDRAARAEADARRARTQTRALTRSNRRLRHELAAAKRARRKPKSQAHK